MMTIKEIEEYLSHKNVCLKKEIDEQTESLRLEAIKSRQEEQANYFWCLNQIYKIQNGYISAIESLKNAKYEDAWLTFDRTDIKLSYLERNFDISQGNDRYHLLFICRMIKEYQKCFPYHYFFSREAIIKSEECSICGKTISLRHPCEHKPGKLYMGEICYKKVTDIEFKAFSIVTDPFDKYSFVKVDDQEYNYGMLEELMREIDTPYDEFYIETIKVKQPQYRNLSRNTLCPCGSGKKYKNCCGK